MLRSMKVSAQWLCVMMLLLTSAVASAKAPFHPAQVAGWFRLMIGDYEVTALNDGFSHLSPKRLLNISQQSAAQQLHQHFIESKNGVTNPFNAYLINTGKALVLIDSGAGDCFGSESGHLLENLRASGYQPEQIDAVLITHMHSDHLCGVSRNGRRVFPNATLYLPKAEQAYWLSDKQLATANADNKGFFLAARKAVAPYQAAKRIKIFTRGETLFPGIKSLATSGHTPGHTSYRVSSNHQSLMVLGDILHMYAIQLPHPDVAINFDYDSKQAVKTRKQLLRELAQSRSYVAGEHIPFPGIGHIATLKEGGYRWYPIEYRPVKH